MTNIAIFDRQAINQTRINWLSNGILALPDVLSCSIKCSINGEYELELSHMANTEAMLYLLPINIVRVMQRDDGYQLFRIYKVQKSMDALPIITAYARHIYYDLANYAVEDAEFNNVNLQIIFNYLQDCIPQNPTQNFYFYSDYSENISINFDGDNVVSAITKLTEKYGLEIARSNFGVEIKQETGNNKGVISRYGKDILSISNEEDYTYLVTRIKPIGKAGLEIDEKYIYSPYFSYVDIYKIVKFNEIDNIDELRNVGQKWLENNSNVINNFSIEISKLGGKYEWFNAIELGDTITIVHEPLSIQHKSRVISLTVDVLNPINTKIQIGNFLKNIAEEVAEKSSDIDNAKSTADDAKEKSDETSKKVDELENKIVSIPYAEQTQAHINANLDFDGEPIIKGQAYSHIQLEDGTWILKKDSGGSSGNGFFEPPEYFMLDSLRFFEPFPFFTFVETGDTLGIYDP